LHARRHAATQAHAGTHHLRVLFAIPAPSKNELARRRRCLDRVHNHPIVCLLLHLLALCARTIPNLLAVAIFERSILAKLKAGGAARDIFGRLVGVRTALGTLGPYRAATAEVSVACWDRVDPPRRLGRKRAYRDIPSRDFELWAAVKEPNGVRAANEAQDVLVEAVLR